MDIQIQEETNTPKNYATSLIRDCVKFWIREGDKAVKNNKSGKWGSKETQKMAQTMQPDDFILDMVLCDCKAACNSQFAQDSGNVYECGRTRSHVWVQIDEDRILMIFIPVYNTIAKVIDKLGSRGNVSEADVLQFIETNKFEADFIADIKGYYLI